MDPMQSNSANMILPFPEEHSSQTRTGLRSLSPRQRTGYRETSRWRLYSPPIILLSKSPLLPHFPKVTSSPGTPNAATRIQGLLPLSSARYTLDGFPDEEIGATNTPEKRAQSARYATAEVTSATRNVASGLTFPTQGIRTHGRDRRCAWFSCAALMALILHIC